MTGNVSPIQYSATSVEDLAVKVLYLPATDDVFGQEESFAVCLGSLFQDDITTVLTREQIHALKREIDAVCGAYPLDKKLIKVGA